MELRRIASTPPRFSIPDHGAKQAHTGSDFSRNAMRINDEPPFHHQLEPGTDLVKLGGKNHRDQMIRGPIRGAWHELVSATWLGLCNFPDRVDVAPGHRIIDGSIRPGEHVRPFLQVFCFSGVNSVARLDTMEILDVPKRRPLGSGPGGSPHPWF